MEARDNDDPFFWDVSRVIQELCGPDRTWNAPPAAKLPDPDQLSAKLTEVEIDGEALLTYEGTLGSLNDLLVRELGVKKVPHRMSIQKAIREFQARSAEFKRWKRANSKVESDDELEPLAKPKPGSRGSTDVLVDVGQAAGGASPASHGLMVPDNDGRQGSSLAPQAARSSPTIQQSNDDTVLTAQAKQASWPPTPNRSDISPGDHPDQPPKKKQRIVPTLLTTSPSRTALNFIPTEADILLRAQSKVDQRRTDSASKYAYLGSRGFTFGHRLGPDTSSDEEDSSGQFSFVKTGSDRPGRRLQVNRAMKKYLLQNSGSEVPGTGSEGSSDQLLPLFGESDEEYDDEMWREYEQEEAEREELEALKKTFLSADEVDQVIQEAIKSYEDEWNDKKRPKELMKANKLWNDARRHNSRQRLISDAAGWCRSLDARISKLAQELRGHQWSNVAELERQMEHFELSVGQRQAQRFRLQILSSPVEPQKPRKLTRPAVQKKQAVRRENDEDVLTSDSDDGLDQFIIDDEVEQAPGEGFDPVIVDSGPLSGLYQFDEQGDHRSSADQTGNAAATDEPIEEQLALEQDRDSNYSPPPAVVPMDIDQDPGADTGGDYSPPPAREHEEVTASDGISANPAAQLAESNMLVSKTSDHARNLTESVDRPVPSPIDLTSSNAREVEDTPETPEISRRPNAEEIAALAKLGVLFWTKEGRDPTGLLIALLWKWPADLRNALGTAVRETGRNEAELLWENHVLRAKAVAEVNGLVEASDMDARVSLGLVQLYMSWMAHSDFGYPLRESLSRDDFAQLGDVHKPQIFRKFYRRLRHVVRGYRKMEAAGTEAETSGQDGAMEIDDPMGGPLPSDTEADERVLDEAGEGDGGQDSAAEEEDETEEMPISPSKRSRLARLKNRKRRIVRNPEAADMRETNFQQKALFESRRLKLREEIAELLPKDMARFIINETKEDDEELIYVNPRTRHVIKDHQVEGVRFMWNQIVVKSKFRQGCLLAHTMGLGKTMQVVTLLVAIAEAALSKNEALRKQIPNELRESRTLILCPSGLVDNWIDELNIWTPLRGPEGQPLADNEVGYLGRVYKIEAAVVKSQRPACVSAWQASGGVLVMGYPMFLQLSKDPEVLEILQKTPNIVIADEAHKLKNSTSQIHHATQNFRAASRIAMTGSPLTNNVADYYNMVSWVAPNYLGPYPEFKQVYETPVLGLHADSSAVDKRRAVKTLNILRETVSPLVHRMGILSLKDDLPQKKEFILYLKLTPLQRAAYSAYLQRIVYDSAVRDKLSKGMTSIWTFVNDLAVLLAHPSIYKSRLQRQQAERKALQDVSGEGTPVLSPDEDGGPGAAETATVDVSAYVKSELLATMSTRDLENVVHSYKVVILRTILDECRRIGDKVLVFSQHIATLDFLEEMFRREKRNWYRLDGSTHITERQAQVKRFNDDGKAEVYLISTKAGGEGLNIHGANRVVVFDFKYTPMEEQQAVGRAYRIGQTKPVFVYWLIVADTFEESVQNRSVFKLQLASRVVDKKNPLSWSKRALDLFPKDGRLPSIPPKDPDIPHYSGKDVVLDTLLDSPTLGESIRRIIMTETFEEEEPDDSILTSDDRKEIVQAVAMNHQRGVTGWAGVPNFAAEQQGLMLGPIPGLSSTGLPQFGGLTQAGPFAAPDGRGVLKSAVDVDLPLPNPDDGGVGQQAAEKQHVKERPVARPSAPKDLVLVRSVAAKKRRLADMLWTLHNSLTNGGETPPRPEDFLNALDKALQDHPQWSEDILLLDFCTSLVRTLEKSARFRLAILFGLVNARELTHMNREEISDLVKRYDGMDESTFKRELLGSDKDPSVGTRQFRQPKVGYTN
ncbi:Protein CHROMATIN REMODELING 20 [Coniochaeta hoffmannii]|uniref:Protein CHROMATIN REMODELING 20 n=1 Tax=Coniochaeta hoffmannii TaxID=91930 RepID=A0AA38VZ63_9PEZI|nr:Protein CHROMATIN REMODELING 20 [Coniochaeta hoffmannii]